MNTICKSAIAALALGAAAAPAAADYSIVEDKAFPSVVYIEFDPSTMPTIYTAPVGDPALPIIRGGADDAVQDPAAGQSSQDTARPDDRQSNDSDLTADQRADKKAEELVNSSPQQIEDIIINRKIEDEILKDFDNEMNTGN
ncbi:MAG: hypothetical protein WAU86_24320 [Oricola sp.]